MRHQLNLNWEKMRTKSGELLSMSNTSLTITSIITGVSACQRLSLSQTRHPQLERLRSLVWIINWDLLFAANEAEMVAGRQEGTFLQHLCWLWLSLGRDGHVRRSSIDCYARQPGQTIMVPHLSLQTPSWLLTVSFKTEEILCLVWVLSFDWDCQTC